MGSCELSPAQKSEIERLEELFTQTVVVPPNALTISDLGNQIDSLLRSHGLNDLWQLAAGLARRNIKPEAVEPLFAKLDADKAQAALVRIYASVRAGMWGMLSAAERSILFTLYAFQDSDTGLTRLSYRAIMRYSGVAKLGNVSNAMKELKKIHALQPVP